MHFEISRPIAAPPDAVWRILTNPEILGSGGFGLLSFDASDDPLQRGTKITLRSEAAPKQTFKLRVTEMEAPRAMVWRGGMPLGLFTGRRAFSLTPKDAGTLFTMREDFTGPLAGLIGRSMPDLTPSFETFAAALDRHSTKGPR